MFSFHSKCCIYRELKRAPQKLSFCFKCTDTGTVRILGSILYIEIDDKELDAFVRTILALLPNSGEVMIRGALHGRGQ